MSVRRNLHRHGIYAGAVGLACAVAGDATRASMPVLSGLLFGAAIIMAATMVGFLALAEL